MITIYDWGFFFEDGNKFSVPVPFGPEHPDNTIFDLDDTWIERFNEVYPDILEEAIEQLEWPFAFIVVNPSREALEEEETYFKAQGWI